MTLDYVRLSVGKYFLYLLFHISHFNASERGPLWNFTASRSFSFHFAEIPFISYDRARGGEREIERKREILHESILHLECKKKRVRALDGYIGTEYIETSYRAYIPGFLPRSAVLTSLKIVYEVFFLLNAISLNNKNMKAIMDSCISCTNFCISLVGIMFLTRFLSCTSNSKDKNSVAKLASSHWQFALDL